MIFTLNLGEAIGRQFFWSMLLFIMGLVDDRRSIKPGMKFLIQIIAAYIAMIYGVRIYGLSVPGWNPIHFFRFG